MPEPSTWPPAAQPATSTPHTDDADPGPGAEVGAANGVTHRPTLTQWQGVEELMTTANTQQNYSDGYAAAEKAITILIETLGVEAVCIIARKQIVPVWAERSEYDYGTSDAWSNWAQERRDAARRAYWARTR
jgi:hypothetical protein